MLKHSAEEPIPVEAAKEKSEELIGEEGPAIELKENLPDIVQVNTGEENEEVICWIEYIGTSKFEHGGQWSQKTCLFQKKTVKSCKFRCF